MTEHLSALRLDELALRALAADDERLARAHLASCERCRADFAAIEREQQHFRDVVAPRTTITGRRARAGRPWWTWLAMPVAAVAIVLVVVFVVRRPGASPRSRETSGSSDTGSEEPRYGIKGGATLQVFANRDDKVFAVRDGTTLLPGDRIRFVVAPAGAKYVIIASIDGAGTATIYHPFDGHESAALAGDNPLQVELPGTIVLDTAPGPERIYAIFTTEPIVTTTVKQALQTIGKQGESAIRTTTTLPHAAFAQASIAFEKGAR